MQRPSPGRGKTLAAIRTLIGRPDDLIHRKLRTIAQAASETLNARAGQVDQGLGASPAVDEARGWLGGGKMSANHDLFESIQNGDEDAFVEFLRSHVQARFRRLVRRKSPGLQDADLDDLQAIWMLKALVWYRKREAPLPKQEDALARYCLIMGYHQLTDLARRERRRPLQLDTLERTSDIVAPLDAAWSSRMDQLHEIPREGLSASMVRAYDAVVDLIHDRMRWPSTREVADRLGLSVSQASRLKTGVQVWMRWHLVPE